jgi:uncharacterized RDD family membrane protein YckC
MKNLNLPNKYVVEANASIFKRFVSFIIDILILDFFVIETFSATLSSIVPKADFGATFAFVKGSPQIMSEVMTLLLIMTFLIFIYFFYLQKRFHQTIGMKIMNLKLVNDEAGELKTWQLIVRNLYLIPFFPFIFLWVIDPIYLFIYNKRLSEILSKTRLVEEHKL